MPCGKIIPHRQQIQIAGCQQGGYGGGYGGQRHSAGDGPRDQRGDDDDRVFQGHSQLLFVRVHILTELAGQHGPKGLVAGDHAGQDRGDQDRTVGGYSGAKSGKLLLWLVQDSGSVEDSGKGRGDTDNGKYLSHGDDASAVQQG